MRKALAIMAAVAAAAQARAERIAYPAQPSAHLNRAGISYVARLEPERDVAGHVVSLDLELRRTGKARAGNLLAPVRNWHGRQSFMLDACEVRLGLRRDIPIRGTGWSLRLRVTGFRAAADCSLESLALELAILRR
jgi:hypothetical protein